MGLAREEGGTVLKTGRIEERPCFGARFKQVFGQAAPQGAKEKHTTFEGISQ